MPNSTQYNCYAFVITFSAATQIYIIETKLQKNRTQYFSVTFGIRVCYSITPFIIFLICNDIINLHIPTRASMSIAIKFIHKSFIA